MNRQNRQLLAHLAFALTNHVKKASRDGLLVPPELPIIAEFLTDIAQTRQDAAWFEGVADLLDAEGMTNQPMLLTRSQAASALGLSVRTVDRLIASGALPVVGVGKSPRVRRIDLDAYVESLGSRSFRDEIDTKETA